MRARNLLYLKLNMDGMCPLESSSQNARNATEKAQDWMKILWINKLNDVNYVADGKWNTTNAVRVNSSDMPSDLL